MGIEHVNRKGDRYHLQAMPAKGGKLRYSFARKLKGQPVDAVPDGHEVYEEPEDGQVFLRRKLASAILPLEKELVARGIRRRAGLEHFIVDVEKDAIVVYLCDTDADEVVRMISRLSEFPASRGREAAQTLAARSTYGKMMRFELRDTKARTFCVYRWCFMGGIDNWILLDGPETLVELVDKYVGHLGKESFFELM
jgi:hypothetical protein